MISIFDLFKIGIGPSSSHTVGPMLASAEFLKKLVEKNLINKVNKVKIILYGSLSLTGKGHGTDLSTLLGLEGNLPDKIDPNTVISKFQNIKQNKKLNIAGKNIINFDYETDLIFSNEFLDFHSNAMKIEAFGDGFIEAETYYSVGGGFIINESHKQNLINNKNYKYDIPYVFNNAKELVEVCQKNNLTIAQLALENEKSLASETEVLSKLDKIISTMLDSVEAGLKLKKKAMPGNNKIISRASTIYQKLNDKNYLKNNLGYLQNSGMHDIDWISVYAIAASEINGSYGRIVTAPTNGAAGIIPAILMYLKHFDRASQEQLREFLLVSYVIGLLFKQNASISGAEVGCQGEIGVACSMAAAGYTAIKTAEHKLILNAAEIGMEHNLGLTCDPVGGLVLIPCIERNAIGAVKAVQASRIAILNEGEHLVSFDEVVATMYQIGKDMESKYKETSMGGLAVNVTFC